MIRRLPRALVGAAGGATLLLLGLGLQWLNQITAPSHISSSQTKPEPAAGTSETEAPIKIAAGTYTAAGQMPSGQAYGGEVAIAPLNKVMAVLWQLDRAGAYKGIGLESGAIFGVAYSSGRPFGLVIYDVEDGRLDGRWSLAADDGKGIGRETLRGPAGLNGTYTITRGENPVGGGYSGHVEIHPTGKTYTLRWFTPDAGDIGTGVLVGRTLVVAYGREPGFGVVAYRREGDHLHGVWAGTLGSELGAEDLTLKAP